MDIFKKIESTKGDNMKRLEKILILFIVMLIILFIGIINAYASNIWNGYHYMSLDMSNRTILAQEDFKILNENQTEKDRAIAVDRLLDYSNYLYNEFHLEIRCFVHNKETNDKLYHNFCSQAKTFNKFLIENRNNLIINSPKEIEKLVVYNDYIDHLEGNLSELRAYYPIIMPRGASIDIMNPYSKANSIVNKVVSSFD